MATLTIADLDNGKRDLQTVDEVANSSADTTTTRYGDSVLTLAGALRRLGYQAPVPYAPGLNVDSPLFTVSHGGVIYAPDPEIVPFVSGAWDPDQWRVVQDRQASDTLFVFSKDSEAAAAAALIPDGSTVEVVSSSAFDGKTARFTVASGTLTGGYAVPAPQQWDTFDDLRASTAHSNGVAFLIGRNQRLDGGGGVFILDLSDTTSADNGSSVLVDSAGGRWKIPSGKAISASEFGAFPLGAASDQTARIQAAIDANPGAEVTLSSGVYRCDSPVFVRSGTRLTMAKGAELRRFSSGSASTAPVLYLLDSYSECRGGRITTQNGAPSGVVVLGHESASDNRNAWYWKFKDVDIEGNGTGWGWVVTSGQVTYPTVANYFGTVDSVTARFVDFGCLFFEDANAHNISNVHYWQCKVANIWMRGAYGNSFVNMFFHQGAKDGVIGIHLVNRVLGAFNIHSDQNKFMGFTAETGQPLDRVFVIEDRCTHNILIGTSNVAGAYVLGNVQNTIQLEAYGVAMLDLRPGSAFRKTAVPVGVATPVTPSDFLGLAESGSSLIAVSVCYEGNASLNRTDLILVTARTSAFGPSAVTLVSSAFMALGSSGEPTSTVYSLNFDEGATRPRLQVVVSGAAGSTYRVSGTVTRVVA